MISLLVSGKALFKTRFIGNRKTAKSFFGSGSIKGVSLYQSPFVRNCLSSYKASPMIIVAVNNHGKNVKTIF